MMSYTGRSPAEEDAEGVAARNVDALVDEVCGLLGLTP
jgi:hypothetical protein